MSDLGVIDKIAKKRGLRVVLGRILKYTNVFYIIVKIYKINYKILRRVRGKLLKKSYYYYRIFIFLEEIAGLIIGVIMDIVIVILRIYIEVKRYVIRVKARDVIEGRIVIMFIITVTQGVLPILYIYIIYRVIKLWYFRMYYYLCRDRFKDGLERYRNLEEANNVVELFTRSIHNSIFLKLISNEEEIFIYYKDKKKKRIDIKGGYRYYNILVIY